jgi:hypothetical protein
MLSRFLVAAFHSKWVIAGSIVFRSLYPDFSQYDAARIAAALDPLATASHYVVYQPVTEHLSTVADTAPRLVLRKKEQRLFG